MAQEFGWVVERHMMGKLHYWCGIAPSGKSDWQADSTSAVRFCREADADRVLYSPLCDGIGRTAQHGWGMEDDRARVAV